MSQHYDAGQAGGDVYTRALELARYVARFDRNDPSALKDAMRGIIRKAREVVGPCGSCGANLADDIGDGVAGHWQNCPAQAICCYCGQHVSRSPAGYWTLGGGDERAAIVCDQSPDNRHDVDAEQDTPEQDKWRTANNGTAKRMWFLIRTDESVPVAERYHTTAAGDLIRYASDQNAQHVADRLNAEARRG